MKKSSKSKRKFQMRKDIHEDLSDWKRSKAVRQSGYSRDRLEISNSQYDSGCHLSVNASYGSQLQESLTNIPSKHHDEDYNSSTDTSASENLSQKHEHEKSYIFSCVAGSCIGLAVAYFVGVTSIYVTTGVFVGMVLAGALVGYSIARLYDKVGTRIDNLSTTPYIAGEQIIDLLRKERP